MSAKFLNMLFGNVNKEEGGQPGTLRPFEFEADLSTYRDEPIDNVVKRFLQELREYKDQRFQYFNNLRRIEAPWANGARKVLAVLGTIAILLAAVASTSTLVPQQGWIVDNRIALWAALGSLVAYALIGAISFYEKATDTTSSYFRHLAITASVRDLWTRLEFAMLKVVLDTKKNGPETADAARERLHALAEAFCVDLNKVATGELTEWRTEFISSLSEIEETARKGREATEKTLQAVIADMRAATEKAVQAAAAAEQALKPAIMNLILT